MHPLAKAMLFAISLLQIPSSDQARPQLTILVLNGVSGKPVPNVRLLIFAGATPEQVEDHRTSFDLRTNNDGVALVPPGQMWPSSLLVFVDFMTQCEPHPNLHSLSLPRAMKDGLVATNGCGSFSVPPKPGQLVVFARKPTFRERMAW